MRRKCGSLFFLFALILPFKYVSSNTFIITDQIKNHQDPIYNIFWLEDDSRTLDIHDILDPVNQKRFSKNESEKLNFGFSKSGIWLKLKIKNESDFSDFVLAINNSDLNYVDCYKVSNNHIIDSVITGELVPFSGREIENRNFLFNIQLDKNEKITYYFYVYNSTDAISIPFSIYLKENFYEKENISILILGLFFGFGLFIILFNFYLFFSLKDKVHLYYALYVFFTFLFTFNMDGLSPQFFWPNSPGWSNSSTFMFSMFGIIFLINFVEVFLKNDKLSRRYNVIFSILKIATVVLFLCSFFDFLLPFAVLGLLFVFSTNLCLIVFVSYSSLNKQFIPNHYFLGAFLFMIVGAIIYALRELGILPYNLLTKNVFRIAIVFETIILTIAIIERFRVNQLNAKKAIEESSARIDAQNKELEFINVELEKLSIVASETDNSVAIYDTDGKIEWCNESFERFYETNIDELVNKKKDKIEDIIPYNNLKELLDTCLLRKEPINFETQLIFDNNKSKWMQTTLSPYIKAGRVRKVIAVDTEITGLKEYEANLKMAKEKAEESDRLKTIFLNNVSHEIRTPLNGIIGFSELLNNSELSPEEFVSYVKIIKSSGEHLTRIIDDILDMSLIETNQIKMNPTLFSLTELLEEIVVFFDIYKTSINKSQIELIKELDIDSERDSVFSDKSRLKQVLINLVKNGLKFTDEGYVKVNCIVENENINFFVEDTGIGIDPSKVDFIFERFRQADENYTREYGGNGLGLTISKGIVEKLGGKIWIDTQYTDGFRICFTLPFNRE